MPCRDCESGCHPDGLATKNTKRHKKKISETSRRNEQRNSEQGATNGEGKTPAHAAYRHSPSSVLSSLLEILSSPAHWRSQCHPLGASGTLRGLGALCGGREPFHHREEKGQEGWIFFVTFVVSSPVHRGSHRQRCGSARRRSGGSTSARVTHRCSNCRITSRISDVCSMHPGS